MFNEFKRMFGSLEKKGADVSWDMQVPQVPSEMTEGHVGTWWVRSGPAPWGCCPLSRGPPLPSQVGASGLWG